MSKRRIEKTIEQILETVRYGLPKLFDVFKQTFVINVTDALEILNEDENYFVMIHKEDIPMHERVMVIW